MGTSAIVSVAVVGAGAWGTVLAGLLARNPALGVTLWARRPEQAAALCEARQNTAYLPGFPLPPGLRVTSCLADLSEMSALFLAVPSRSLRKVLKDLPLVPALVSCAKGLEEGSFKRLTEVVADYQPQAALAALSGPNLAGEIARGLPSSATVASSDPTLARRVQGWLTQDVFRVYTGTDLIGLELGGAFKNVVALAAGMSDGLGLGDNAKAALMTRGLAEMVRLGTHLGGEVRTFYGLSGLGDLIATCSSEGSRNHQAGARLAHGETLVGLEAAHLTAEGVPTAQAVAHYAHKEGIDLPISQAVYDVVFGGASPVEMMRELMTRGAKAEW